MMYDLFPNEDRLVVRPDDEEEMTKGGLYIPDVAKDRPQTGVVIARGPGRYENGHLILNPFFEGERVMYGKYAGQPIEINGERLIVLRASEVLMALRESSADEFAPTYDAN